MSGRSTLGDTRFTPSFRKVRDAADPACAMATMSDQDLVAALAGASHEHDPYFANVLGTEVSNRLFAKDAVIEASAEALFAIDTEGRFLFANPALGCLIGRDAEQLRGTPMHDAISHRGLDHREHAPDECHILGVISSRTPRVGEGEFLRADGSYTPVAYSAAPLTRMDEVFGAVIVARDITRNLESQRALAASEAMFHQLADAASEGVVLHENGRILRVNRAVADMAGIPPSAFIGHRIDEFIAPASRAEVLEHLHDASGRRFPTQLRAPTGDIIDVEIIARDVPEAGPGVRVAIVRFRERAR